MGVHEDMKRKEEEEGPTLSVSPVWGMLFLCMKKISMGYNIECWEKRQVRKNWKRDSGQALIVNNCEVNVRFPSNHPASHASLQYRADHMINDSNTLITQVMTMTRLLEKTSPAQATLIMRLRWQVKDSHLHRRKETSCNTFISANQQPCIDRHRVWLGLHDKC